MKRFLHKNLSFACLITVLIFVTAISEAQPVLNNLWPVPNGDVYAVVQSGNTIYIGGSFSRIGSMPYGASLDAGSGEPDLSYAKANGTVRCAVPDGSGGWYIGGEFTLVGGITRNRIARINADGSLNNWNPNANNTVFTLAVSGNTVYAGGAFTSIGGQTRNNIAALDATLNTNNATAWNPAANSGGSVFALAVSGTTVYAGGSFTNIGGQSRNRIAALDASLNTNNATAWNPDAGLASVFALAVSGNTVYAGGSFSNIGGQPRNNLAALDATVNTNNATAWDPNANSFVRAITIVGNTVYAGGNFTSVGGQTRNRLAALDATINTNNATSWDPNADNQVWALTADGNTVYAGGDFTSIGGQNRTRIAALDASINTGNATSWNPDAGATIYTLAAAGSKIYAGGGSSTIGGKARSNIAAFNAGTGAITSWAPDANGTVRALAVSGNTVYAVGEFTSIGGQTRNRIAAIDATVNTNNATAWDPNANSIVLAVAVNGKTVYIGGGFSNVGGQSRNRIAALDASINTGNATAWNPDANNTVNTIAISGSTVYVGGVFTSIGGQFRNRIAALDATLNSANATAWDPNVTLGSSVNALVINGNTIYAGGDFTGIGGVTRNRIAAIDATLNTGNLTAWNPNAGATVNSLALSGNTIYVGGQFTSIGGAGLRNRLAALNTTINTNNATTWNPNLNGVVYALAIGGSSVYAGGSFSSIGTITNNNFAKFKDSVGWSGTSNSDWFTPANWSNSIVPISLADITVPGGLVNYPDLSSGTATCNDLSIANGASVTVSGTGDLQISGSMTNNGSFTGTSGTISLIGSTTQSLSTASLNNLTINNTEGVVLAGNVTINGTLSFTNGKLTIGANDLILNGTVSGSDSEHYVVATGAGSVQGVVNNTTPKVFPVGDLSNYLPVSIKFTAGVNNNFSVRTSGFSGSLGGANVPLTNQWEIANTTGTNSNSVDFTFGWPVEAEQGMFNAGQVYLAHYDGANWQSVSATSDASGSDPRLFTKNNYSGGFSPFTIAYSSTPLFMDLADFNAVNSGKVNIVEWRAIHGDHSEKMELEHSSDGSDFSLITAITQQPSGTYRYIDTQPFYGINYYRLKMISSDGSIHYSNTAIAIMSVTDQDLVIFPNPTKGLLSIHAATGDEATVIIYDVMGKELGTWTMKGQQNTIDLSSFEKGVLILKYQYQQVTGQQRIILR